MSIHFVTMDIPLGLCGMIVEVEVEFEYTNGTPSSRSGLDDGDDPEAEPIGFTIATITGFDPVDAANDFIAYVIDGPSLEAGWEAFLRQAIWNWLEQESYVFWDQAVQVVEREWYGNQTG